MKKVLSILLVMVMLVAIGSTFVLADNLDPSTITGNSDATGIKDVRNIGEDILGVIQVAGSVIAVIILVVIGIKYMMGSASEKAEYKKVLIPYIIGAVLIFAASNVAGIVYKWAGQVGKSEEPPAGQVAPQD